MEGGRDIVPSLEVIRGGDAPWLMITLQAVGGFFVSPSGESHATPLSVEKPDWRKDNHRVTRNNCNDHGINHFNQALSKSELMNKNVC